MLLISRLLSRLSLRWLHGLGALLGWMAWLFSPRYRRRLLEHSQVAGLSPEQQRAAIAEAGRMSLELPRIWLRAPGRPVADPVRWDGAELIEQAMQSSKGLLLLTPHLGSFEVAAQAYADRFGAQKPVTVLYRPARKDWLRRLQEAARVRPGLTTAPAALSGVRQMLRALREGQAVGLLPDQVPPRGQGVVVDFFGRPAYTMTLAARLLRHSSCNLLLVWCERLPRGAGYVVHVRKPMQALPAASDEEGHQSAEPRGERAWLQGATAMITRDMQSLIAECPQQYLWGYNRYKMPAPADQA